MIEKKWVDASLQAARGGELQQTFLLKDLPRVSEHAVDARSAVTLQARFNKVEHQVMVEGSVAAKLQLTCQRCLQPVKIDVSDDFSLVVVPSEGELSKLSESQDAIVADPTKLDLASLAEEQLLLAAPLVPVHADIDECGLAAELFREPAESESVVTESVQSKRNESLSKDTVVVGNSQLTTQRPFAVLRDLMKKD